jgi:hypothetical protein
VLALDRVGLLRNSAVRTADRPSHTKGQKFALGGVAFEVLVSGIGRSGLVLEPDVERYAAACNSHPVIADVLCSVSIDDTLFEGASPYGDLELNEGAFDELGRGELTLRAPRVQATLCRIASQRYACSAKIANDPRALTALLRSIIAVVVHAAGGVVVHAAGVALDERAILYLGPSGAGKSTAATLTQGSRMFACDHVALVPQRDGVVLAYGLPGGTVAAMAQTDKVVWPLGGVFRILRDGHDSVEPRGPRVRTLSGAEALFVLREAVESADTSASAEQARLDAVTAIANAAVVGTLHTVLGISIGRFVRDELRARTDEARV